MSFAVRDELERLGAAWVDSTRAATGALPFVDFEPDWTSPCIVASRDGRSFWRPLAMETAPDFSGLQRALEVPLHLDVLSYYGSYWSGALPVTWEGSDFELLQLWNEQDLDNLISNLIGHALEKRRIRQPLSIFFAVVDDARFLSVQNDGGQVLLETLGTFHPEEIAASLGEFLGRLEAQKKSPP